MRASHSTDDDNVAAVMAFLLTYMAISLSPKTQRLVEERMKERGAPSADDVVLAAFHALDELQAAEPDDDTWAAIDRAEEQFQRGEGLPLDEAFERVRRKRFGARRGASVPEHC